MLSMIADWQQSGKRKKAYCAENGINEAKFYLFKNYLPESSPKSEPIKKEKSKNNDCHVSQNKGAEGITITFTRPEPIGEDEKVIIGTSIQTDGKESFFLTNLLKSKHELLKAKGDLFIRFDNNESSILKPIANEVVNQNGQTANMVLYLLTKDDIKKVKTLKLISFGTKRSDELMHLINISNKDSGLLQHHLKCIENTLK